MDKKSGPQAQNQIDPDIASLFQIPNGEQEQAAPGPDFRTLFDEDKPGVVAKPLQVDTSRTKFPKIAKLQDEPRPLFEDKDFYKKVLGGEGEEGPRVHDLLGKYMKAEDPEEKSRFRAQLITAVWELGGRIAYRANAELPLPKRLFLRFGVLSPGFLTPELRDMVSRIVFDNATGEPLHYADEWLEHIARGHVRPSTVDEVKVRGSGKAEGQKIVDALEKKRGQRDSELTILKAKLSQMEEREAALRGQVDALVRHDKNEQFGLKSFLSPAQKAAATQIQELLREIMNLDAQVVESYRELTGLDKELESLGRKSEGISADSLVDQKAVVTEWMSLRQMAKMCVGRQGNHFPIFVSQYVRPNLKEIGTRENVLQEMAMVEALDPGLFLRTYKNQTARIVPNVILLASYGDTGICWEPFERFNRATSRGRIAIPMFPKSLPVAVLTALADLRWQVAKEKAQYYWMEEGITGKYYQWFSERKLRGDVREYFIRDYALWINKESQGMQKLDKEVRGIFWRMMPFPQQVKDSLRNRSFVYNELYKKDQNIAKSDGY